MERCSIILNCEKTASTQCTLMVIAYTIRRELLLKILKDAILWLFKLQGMKFTFNAHTYFLASYASLTHSIALMLAPSFTRIPIPSMFPFSAAQWIEALPCYKNDDGKQEEWVTWVLHNRTTETVTCAALVDRKIACLDSAHRFYLVLKWMWKSLKE